MQSLHVPDVLPGTGSPPILLTIAGFDPSSGAGITADLKVFAAHSMYGVAATTALTVQSTSSVRRVEPVEAGLLTDMLTCLAEDLPLAGVKVGMLATAANVRAVAAFLSELCAASPALCVVLDPVLCSTSGYPLLEPAGLDALHSELLPLVTCVTPNTDELRLLLLPACGSGLSGEPSKQAIEEAARALATSYPCLAVVVTGGDLATPEDCVYVPGHKSEWLRGLRVHTQATHGTGCAFSSAILCGLVQGYSVQEAAHAAKLYVTEALRAATPIGAGGGSMHHLYAAFGGHIATPTTAPNEQNRTKRD